MEQTQPSQMVIYNETQSFGTNNSSTVLNDHQFGTYRSSSKEFSSSEEGSSSSSSISNTSHRFSPAPGPGPDPNPNPNPSSPTNHHHNETEKRESPPSSEDTDADAKRKKTKFSMKLVNNSKNKNTDNALTPGRKSLLKFLQFSKKEREEDALMAQTTMQPNSPEREEFTAAPKRDNEADEVSQPDDEMFMDETQQLDDKNTAEESSSEFVDPPTVVRSVDARNLSISETDITERFSNITPTGAAAAQHVSATFDDAIAEEMTKIDSDSNQNVETPRRTERSSTSSSDELRIKIQGAIEKHKNFLTPDRLKMIETEIVEINCSTPVQANVSKTPIQTDTLNSSFSDQVKIDGSLNDEDSIDGRSLLECRSWPPPSNKDYEIELKEKEIASLMRREEALKQKVSDLLREKGELIFDKDRMYSEAQENETLFEEELNRVNDEMMEMQQQNEAARESLKMELQASFKKEIEQWKKKAQQQEEQFNRNLQEQAKQLKEANKERIQSLQNALYAAQTEAETRIREIQDEHSNEIEEMITQLDAIEEELNTKYNEGISSITKQKDVIINALSTHLAEEREKNEAFEAERESNNAEIDALSHENEQLKQSIDQLKVEYQKILDEERNESKMREKKIEQEIRSAAQRQFSEANKYYLQLKNDYDSTCNENAALKNTIKEVQSKADSVARERKGVEMELKSEVARLKAGMKVALNIFFFLICVLSLLTTFVTIFLFAIELANNEAKHAKEQQEATAALDQTQEIERELRAKLDEANTNCTQAHMSLATVVHEKEKLEKENKELTSLSEELMGMVERGETA